MLTLVRKNWLPLFDKHDIRVNNKLDEQNIVCPFHDDRLPSCSVNMKKGIWYCHSGCGGGTLDEFFKDLGETVEAEVLTVAQILDKMTLETMNETPFWGGHPKVELPWDDTIVLPDEIKERGFDISDARRWKFSMSESGSMVIPINDLDGRMVGWVCKKLNGQLPKYVYSQGLAKSKLLFGADKIKFGWNGILILVEGPLDAIWLEKHFHNAVAVLGGTCSREQFDVIEKLAPKEVVTCFDNDAVGKKLTEDVFGYFSDRRLVTAAHLPKDVKDIQDVKNPKQIEETIKQRTIFWRI